MICLNVSILESAGKGDDMSRCFLSILHLYIISSGIASPSPIVTPTIAPADTTALLCPLESSTQAMESPNTSLHTTSDIWDMAVGTMLLNPWVYPLITAMAQENNTAGASTLIPGVTSGSPMSLASCVSNMSIIPMHTRPSTTNVAIPTE